MRIVIAEAAHDEHGSGYYGYEGSTPGDQLQTESHYNEEVRYNSWYDKPWVHIYKPVDENVANEIAIRAEQTVRNKHVGYSQPGRLGFYYKMMADPDPSHISEDVECDCSSKVNSIVYVTLKTRGIDPVINGTEVTAQMAEKYEILCQRGIFEDIIDKVNLVTGEGTSRGCVLLGAPATHTAIICVAEEEKEEEKKTEWNQTPQWVGQVYNCDCLNVRTGPAATYPNYEKWPTLSRGNLIDVCDAEGSWYYVRIAGKHFAWVHKNYITGEVKEGTARTGKVTAACLCLRKSPIDGTILRYMTYNSEVTIFQEVTAKNGALWYEAAYRGVKGYCSAKYIKE